MINGNFINFMNYLGVMKQNPQQAVLNLLQQGANNGKINQQQYNMLINAVQNGVNPNQIIQQLMSSGIASQQDYEAARQGAAMFNRKG